MTEQATETEQPDWANLHPDSWPYTPPLAVYQALLAKDDNLFWRTPDGHILNLMEEATGALDRVRALIVDPGEPQYDDNGNFLGFTALEAHRTVGGHRAWTTEGWCYPRTPCAICQDPIDASDLVDALDG
ncbi:hypothetical protein [Ornithinimicrobium murale]|uniref:hypothetical protein n=1 Tax=Ornithinimicrobium murale TaxID=1050153 RepID=UPI000E0CD723|nr:hypothetical protein [Ornithinimicrobium murale]